MIRINGILAYTVDDESILTVIDKLSADQENVRKLHAMIEEVFPGESYYDCDFGSVFTVNMLISFSILVEKVRSHVETTMHYIEDNLDNVSKEEDIIINDKIYKCLPDSVYIDVSNFISWYDGFNRSLQLKQRMV